MSRITVIGAGVVGSATGFGFAHHNHDVSFVDVNDATLSNLKKKGFAAIKPDDLNLNQVDVVFVAVTALTGEQGIDLTYLKQATRNIGEKLKDVDNHFPVIVYRCTMVPGTMRDVLIPLLEKFSGKKAGKDFGVVYNPEYLRAASAKDDFLHPRVVTLSSLKEHDRAHQIVHDIMVEFGVGMFWLSLEAAEFQKYVNNVGNAIKISTYNWFRHELAATLGIDPEQAGQAIELSVQSAEGLWNSTYGTRDFGPYGGACLPKDTKALIHFAADHGIDTSLLDAVESINDKLIGDAQTPVYIEKESA